MKVPRVVIVNRVLAQSLGLNLEYMPEQELAQFFSGNQLPKDAIPIAMAYAGHQFGHFFMLGDGRAHLLGEVTDKAGIRRDIQLKGSGRTPYSRRGDGRAALAPMLREYIISEAMHGLGIPTTRSLAVVTTGEDVIRETVLQGAILTRVAASHLRVGTFEYAAAKNDVNSLKQLADYAIERHYPHLAHRSNRYAALIEAVADAQASLIARWMHVGFIHGVMNTDIGEQETPYTANIDLTGHSLGGGLAGFVAATYQQDAVIFDGMAYQLSSYALQAREQVAQLVGRDQFLIDIYGTSAENPNPPGPNFSGITAIEVEDEVLSYGARAMAGADPTVPALSLGENVTGLSAIDRHSVSTLVIRMFADSEVTGDNWEKSAQYYWPVMYDDAFAIALGNASGGIMAERLVKKRQSPLRPGGTTRAKNLNARIYPQGFPPPRWVAAAAGAVQ